MSKPFTAILLFSGCGFLWPGLRHASFSSRLDQHERHQGDGQREREVEGAHLEPRRRDPGEAVVHDLR